ncbi:MAG: glycosyltransferase [Calditrichaceae bacterium]|nr:glycosyltransferase [Calditrichaceae bacterium]MBN2709064.1 glycosyltransferase [Calditrichaceae bacterium]RQV97022.1 MAG: glycosyltransferase [Calditrichota bacterium]
MAGRCLIAAYYFPPAGGGGVQRISKFIKYAGRAGWQFTVVTGDKDNSQIPEDSSQIDEIKPFCRVLPVSVSAIHTKAGVKSTFFTRWMSAFFYIPDVRKKWARKAEDQIIALFNQDTYDCVLISSPPYSLAQLAARLSRQLPVPVILDMRDPWSTNPYKIHPTPFHLWLDRALEFKAVKNIRFGISAYQTLIDFYQKNIKGFGKAEWRWIPNGFDEEDFSAIGTSSFNDNGLHIGFSGTFYSHLNHPEPLFKAMALLNEKGKNSIPGKRIIFHHIGRASIDVQSLALKYGLRDQVILHGYQPHVECLKILNRMNAFVFFLDDHHKNSANTIGGKVYEYLKLKKPVLAVVPENGEAAKLINSTCSGVVVSYHDVQAIVRTLETWLNRSPDLKFENIEAYTRQNLSGKMLDFINFCLDRK